MEEKEKINNKMIDDILSEFDNGEKQSADIKGGNDRRRSVSAGSEDIQNKINEWLSYGKSMVKELKSEKLSGVKNSSETSLKAEAEGNSAEEIQGEEKSSDTEKQIAETKKEIIEAQKQISESKKEITETEKQISEKNQEIAGAEQQITETLEVNSDTAKKIDLKGEVSISQETQVKGEEGYKDQVDTAENIPVLTHLPAVNEKSGSDRSKKLDKFFEDYEKHEGIVIGKKSRSQGEKRRPSTPIKESPKAGDDEGEDVVFGDGIIGRLMTEENDTEEPATLHRERPETIEEYTGEESKEEVVRELTSLNRKGLFRTVVCFALSAVVLILNLLAAHSTVFSSFNESGVFSLSIINVLLMVVIIAMGIGSFLEGIGGLISFKPTKESLPTLAIMLSVIYGIYISFSQNAGAAALSHSVFGVAAISFSLAVYGKYLHNRAVCKNFDIVSRNRDKFTVHETFRKTLPKDLRSDCEKIQTVVKTDIVTDFLEKSYKDHTRKKSNKLILLYVLAIIALGVLGVYKSGDMGMNSIQALLVSLSSAAAAAAVFSGALTYTLPYFIATVRSYKSGGAIIGYSDTDRFRKVDAFLMKDEIMFRGSDCTIKGMKMLDGSDIYDAITKIASILNRIGGPLATCFTSVLGNKAEQLVNVEHVKVFEGKGIEAKIGEERVFFGTTLFLKSCGIRMPENDYEAALDTKGKEALLFAEKGHVRALFVIEYGVFDENMNAAKMLENENMSLLIFTKDYHIDEKMVKSRTGTKDLDVHILGPESAPDLEPDLAARNKTASSILSVTGLQGIITAIRSQKKLKKSFKILTVIKYFSMALALLILGFMIYSNAPVACAQLLAYQLIWFAVSILIAYII